MYEKFFKRFLDFWISLIALLVLFPLILILSLVGTIAMKGNPFFIQFRPGKINKKTGIERIFLLIKFRTMDYRRDADGELLPDEMRLTSYGRILRKTSLDELPELINILIGDMALVGPRPQLIRDMVFMSTEQRQRHTVRPGLTGLAQISGRNAISWENKLATDLVYLRDISIGKDLKIVLKTIRTVLSGEDVFTEGVAGANMDYGDYLLKSGRVSEQEYGEKQNEALRILQNK